MLVGYLRCPGTLRGTAVSSWAQMSAFSSGLQPSLGVQLSVTAQTGLSGSSQAVSFQCKCVAKAEARSPGEAGCKLSCWNGSSLSESGLGPCLQPQLPPTHTPAIYSIALNPPVPSPLPLGFEGGCAGGWWLGSGRGLWGPSPLFL